MAQRPYLPHEGVIMIIYGDTLTVPKPVYGIDAEKEPLTLDGLRDLVLKREKKKLRRSQWTLLLMVTTMW